MIVSGAQNTTFDVYRENKQWDTAIYGTKNSWDPQQPLILVPGMTLYFLYSDPTTDNTPPVATIWLRYNADLWPMGNRLWDGKTHSPRNLPLATQLSISMECSSITARPVWVTYRRLPFLARQRFLTRSGM